MGKITIAIDGHSSTGKSTLAKQLAKALHYIYVDTGAMYRAVTLFALHKGYLNTPDGKAMLIASVPHIALQFVHNTEKGNSEIHLNGKNVEMEIRTMKVSQHVSQVAAIEEVRHHLVKLQQHMGKDKGVVMDGRDIGTVVFPDAELKLFLTASLTTRAQRRYTELRDKGEAVTYDEVHKNIQERDLIDSTREIDPLRKAKDAIAFDNSNIDLKEQFKQVYDYALQAIAKKQRM